MTISKSLVTMMMMKRMKMMEIYLIQFVLSVIMEGSSYGKQFPILVEVFIFSKERIVWMFGLIRC